MEANTQNNNDQISHTKNTIHKINQEDSETYDSSLKTKTDSSTIERLSLNLQKSIGFFQKKIYIEEPEDEETKNKTRKYSLDEELLIEDFVPKLRPIRIHLVPSKLCLNKKGFKDLKCNKNNKILLESNNYYISCPNSEEESDIYLSPEKPTLKINQNIKKTRNYLQRMKSCNIPKVFSKNNLNACKKYEKDINFFDNSSNNDSSNYGDNDNFDLYNNDYISWNNKNEINQEKEDEKDEGVKRSNRINSCSILDVLKSKLSFDKLDENLN